MVKPTSEFTSTPLTNRTFSIIQMYRTLFDVYLTEENTLLNSLIKLL